MHGKSYRDLAIQLILHFIIMYLVMYTMIASLDHFYFNLNNVYMTLMMVTPMAVLMLVLMRSMYENKRANLAIAIGAVVIFAGSFYAMRTQAAIGDKELIRGMIPHHSGARDQSNAGDSEPALTQGATVRPRRFTELAALLKIL